MKTLRKFFYAMVLLMLMACSPTVSEIWINEDGGGKTIATLDMGEYFEMMGPMLESFGGKDEDEHGDYDMGDYDMGDEEMEGEEMEGEEMEGEEMEDIEIDVVDMEEIDAEEYEDADADNVFGGNEDMDSLMVLYDIMPDSIKEILEHPEHMKNISMHIKSNMEEKTASMSLIVEFDSKEHLNAIKETLTKSLENQEQSPIGNPEKGFEKFFSDFEIDVVNKTVSLPAVTIDDVFDSEDDKKFVLEKIDSIDLYPEESFEKMMLEILMGSDMKYIINTPGPISSCSDASAEIDGNRVIVTQKAADLIKKGSQEAVLVKYQ